MAALLQNLTQREARFVLTAALGCEVLSKLLSEHCASFGQPAVGDDPPLRLAHDRHQLGANLIVPFLFVECCSL